MCCHFVIIRYWRLAAQRLQRETEELKFETTSKTHANGMRRAFNYRGCFYEPFIFLSQTVRTKFLFMWPPPSRTALFLTFSKMTQWAAVGCFFSVASLRLFFFFFIIDASGLLYIHLGLRPLYAQPPPFTRSRAVWLGAILTHRHTTDFHPNH